MTENTLALAGGTPVRPPQDAPWPPWPHYDESTRERVAGVLESGKVNRWTGPFNQGFEEALSRLVGVPHAIALMNGTVALESALHALEVGAGDEVIVACRTFIASASAVVVSGAKPVLADVDERSQVVTAETIEPLIGERTRGIVAVHLAGWPCDMDAIGALAERHGLFVIEDCAQSIGATLRGRQTGSFGDAAAFSFCQDKIVTTAGEGGAVLFRDPEPFERAWSYKDHGKSREKVLEAAASTGRTYRCVHDGFGTNWRMTELQAAVGLEQLARLDDWLARRRANAAVLDGGFAGVPGIEVVLPPADIEHAYYKYYALVRADELATGWDRDRVLQAISAEGIPCGSGSCHDLGAEGAFSDGDDAARLRPQAAALGARSMMFQVHPTCGEREMRDTVDAVAKVMAHATTSSFDG